MYIIHEGLWWGEVWLLSVKALEHPSIISSWRMLVYKEDTSNVPMMAILGTWCWMPKILLRKSGVSCIIWGYPGYLWLQETVNEKRNMFSGRTIARYDGSSWVAGFVNRRQKEESGCSAICGRDKFMSLLWKVIAVLHVIQCFLNLLTEIACTVDGPWLPPQSPYPLVWWWCPCVNAKTWVAHVVIIYVFKANQ